MAWHEWYVAFMNRLAINRNVFIFINILIFFLAAGEKLKQPEKCERSSDRSVKTKSGKSVQILTTLTDRPTNHSLLS